MSLSDFTKQDAADIATVLSLAALVEDRTKAEQKALDRLAAKVDKQRNRQTRVNLPPSATAANRMPCTFTFAADLERPEIAAWRGVTADLPDLAKLLNHPKSCPCRGDGLAHTPVDGWSRLSDEVAP